ncbi:MAG: hypothetical protein K6E75_12895, partial [Lachnospiraceae bacterium]|nr:hypothetical protein [Lachnospiraceae bacterium]
LSILFDNKKLLFTADMDLLTESSCLHVRDWLQIHIVTAKQEPRKHRTICHEVTVEQAYCACGIVRWHAGL